MILDADGSTTRRATWTKLVAVGVGSLVGLLSITHLFRLDALLIGLGRPVRRLGRVRPGTDTVVILAMVFFVLVLIGRLLY